MRTFLLLTVFAWLMLLIGGCVIEEKNTEKSLASVDTIDVVHFNIIIAPDLSNRLNRQLYPKPVLDNEIIRLILSMYPNRIAKYRRADGQKDKIRLSFINKSQVTQYNVSPSDMQIDLSGFERQIERIDYLKGRSEKSFTKDTTRFFNALESLTNRAQAEEFGADVWSYLSNLDEYWVCTDTWFTQFNKRTYRNIYRNVLILLTDGYVEAGIYQRGGCPINLKSCMFLSKRRVDDFRDAFKKSGKTNLEEFFITSGYEITPLRNGHLKDLEVLVLELYDRSLAKGGSPTTYPTDMDILSLFWTKWLRDSTIPHFQIESTFASKGEAQETILNFILRDQPGK